ncbi:MAG TPA: serine hydrolase domain-containing protein [Thermomonospora sp.]|nr:serine hydrolase domain-containing protein [Thermomonospora sp.]
MRRRPLSLALAAALSLGSLGLAGAPAAAAPGPVAPAALAAPTSIKFTSFDRVQPAADPVPLTSAPRDLNVTYTHDGRTRTLEDYLSRAAQGLVVLDGDKIVKEWYAAGFSKDTRFQSWSMAKSFTSAAIGIALEEGKIHSLDDTVATYVPRLASSAFGDVSIRDLLRMSSGIAWNEPINDIPLHTQSILGVPTPVMAARQVRAWEPGSQFNYTSMNTVVLALVLAGATGVPYHEYVGEKLWRPAGMADTVDVANDRNGNSLGYCCYYATDRDYARFGKLMLDEGRSRGRQVVPAAWVASSLSPSGVSPRYGLHWWLDGADGFYASGAFGQIIYVSLKHDVVIVKSTFVSLAESETLPVMRAIAAEVARTR